MTPFLFAHDDEIRRILVRRRAALVESRPDFVPRNLEATRDGDTLELIIMGVIGESFFFDATSALDVARVLTEHSDATHIRVQINSPGGDAFDGIAMFNSLVGHGATIETVNMGLAASAAGIVFQAGDVRIMQAATQTMIHRAWTIALGNEGELKAVAAMLEKVDAGIVDLFAARSGQRKPAIRKLLVGDGDSDGTFFTADEAVAAGLADRAEKPAKKQSAAATFDPRMFDHLSIAACLPGATMSQSPETPDTADEVVDAEVVDTPKPPVQRTPAAPQAATFDELVELAGDDNEFIVGQQAGKATLAAAISAYTARLKEQRDAATEREAAAAKQLADVQAAGAGADGETEPLSSSPEGQDAERLKRFSNLGTNLARFAAGITLPAGKAK